MRSELAKARSELAKGRTAWGSARRALQKQLRDERRAHQQYLRGITSALTTAQAEQNELQSRVLEQGRHLRCERGIRRRLTDE
eukprot:3489266-Pleurochrysis_carterae.AAC.1